MKQVAIYCVNYKSYNALNNYIASIESAATAVKESVHVSVFIADNTDNEYLTIENPSDIITIQAFPFHQNLGYFGAIHKMMEQVAPETFDYAIISNVDVIMSDHFFTDLLSLQTKDDTGWIAPQIYSNLEQRDRNPKIMQRYPKRKLQILRTLFRFPLLYNLYTHTVYKSKKLVRHEPGEIFAGHGSFIILTRNYFLRSGIIDYPMFLFCEEIYLGEQCRENGLKVLYEPTIQVSDAEHASTSTFKRSKYCKLNFKAVSYILDTYYA
jgi:GT2 family glycosyltransferase